MLDRHLDYRPQPPRYRPVSSSLIERWLGAEQVRNISERMRGWQGPPVAMANVPGQVYACADGDFAGKILCGYEASLHQRLLDDLKRKTRRNFERLGIISRQLGGFASLSDLISEATTGGKKQVFPFQKTGVTAPATSSSQFMWRLGAQPAAGATASTADTGTVYDNTVTGGLKQNNAATGDTLHFINGWMTSNQAQGSSLMLVDMLYAVNRNYNSTAAQAITGTPTRYQTATTAPGNFLPANVTTALGATAANVTLTYVDQDGNTAEAGAAQAVRVSAAVDTAPFTAPDWYYKLNAGDTGARAMTNFVLSAAMGSGNVDRTICHAIAIIPGIGVANQPSFVDGINTAFNLERVYDGACLTFIELMKSSTTAATYTGQVVLCSG